MGVAESKVVAHQVLLACQRAENEGKIKIDHDNILWKDENIKKTVKNLYQCIPRNVRGSSRQSGIRKAIKRPYTRSNIPQLVEELQDGRETLFSAEQITKDAGSVSASQNYHQVSYPAEGLRSPLVHCYNLVIQSERRRALDQIRLRFLYVAFYRLKKKVQPGSEYSGAIPFLAQVILETGSIEDPFDIVQQRVRTWVSYGNRYDLIAKDLGGLGVLYVLPDSDYLWTKELPKSANNENRIAMIQKLKQLGVPTEAETRGLHHYAEAEMQQIFKPLEASLDGVLNHGLSRAHNLTARDQLDFSTRSQNSTPYNETNSNDVFSPLFRSRGSQQIRNHGPLLNQPESGIQFEWLNVAPHRTGVPQSANSAASQHNPTGNEFNVLNSYSGGTQTQHSEETTTNLQQHDQSNSTTANTPYQYHNDLTDYSTFATMIPSSHPQISLQPATTMIPSSHPQISLSAAGQHPLNENEFYILNSYNGGAQTQHSEETTTDLQQHDQSNSTTANTSYQYHNDLTDYSNFATMLPSSHPEISLQPATIMTPSSRPQISLQRAKAMTPSEHPRNFQPTSSSSPMNPQIPLPPDVSFSILQPRQGLLTEGAIDCL